MPISSKIIDQSGTRQFILIESVETYFDAMVKIKGAGLPAHGTFLIVRVSSDDYRAIGIINFDIAVALGGPSWWETPLGSLPIPKANRIVYINSTESTRAVLSWVQKHSNSLVILLDHDHPVGLLTNPDLSEGKGFFADNSLSNLHGNLISLVNDPRSSLTDHVKPPICPSCNIQDWYKFDTQSGCFYCKNCLHVVRHL